MRLMRFDRSRDRSAHRATGRPAFRTHWSASPSRTRTQDSSRRPRVSRAPAERRLSASSGYRKARREISWRRRFETIYQLLCNLVQGLANRRCGKFREGDSAIAVLRKLGIEWHRAEAGDLQA